MFERKKYKNFAVRQLKGRWTVVVLMTLLIEIVMFIFEIPNFYRMFNKESFQILMEYTSFDVNEFYTLYSDATSTTWASTLIRLIVSSIFTMAAIGVYLKMSHSPEKLSLKAFFEGLNNWWRAILTGVWRFLWVFLWSLLFIIPGIVKSLAYSQMFYLVNEFKDMSVTRSMKISKIITNGHKGDLFVMHLSFIGWGILATLSFGIGYFWLVPYMNMSFVNAYHSMLKEALDMGKLKPEDLQTNEQKI
ncbi:DUF975 family protein [Treponema sp. Marseille-Q3903]|uniref:DUF975 family protein n=1 Tax=Treponema sp. Marseille-Q3903 TaxID=2766703 RepID=UPI001651DA54|nr:DUF975 family protein [Treponema sp. Marseille-Q3903]MBC6713934.1 DUF975 family protein [Treponema sp. Marseille-Q3903]